MDRAKEKWALGTEKNGWENWSGHGGEREGRVAVYIAGWGS